MITTHSLLDLHQYKTGLECERKTKQNSKNCSLNIWALPVCEIGNFNYHTVMGPQCHYRFGEKKTVTQNKELETFIIMLASELNWKLKVLKNITSVIGGKERPYPFLSEKLLNSLIPLLLLYINLALLSTIMRRCPRCSCVLSKAAIQSVFSWKTILQILHAKPWLFILFTELFQGMLKLND